MSFDQVFVSEVKNLATKPNVLKMAVSNFYQLYIWS